MKISPTGIWTDFYTYDRDRGLASALMQFFSNNPTILDIGCGDFFYGSLLANCYGIEGNPIMKRDRVQIGDLTEIDPWPHKVFEWCLCFEVGEHIPLSRNDGLFRLLRRATKGVILSWADGSVSGGAGHVAELPQTEVINKMKENGFEHISPLSRFFRQRVILPWFKKTLCVYEKI